MNLLAADQAFSAGSELWILEDNPQNNWWNKIDFRSGFLLSKSLYHHKAVKPQQLLTLLQATEIKPYSFTEDENILLLGSSDHFHNRWILLWKNNPEVVVQKLAHMAVTLKIKNIRIFSDHQVLNPLISARLTASFDQISYVASL